MSQTADVKTTRTRHFVFLGLALVVTLAMLSGVRPTLSISSDTQRLYDFIDSLPSGSALLVSFDHEASSLPEIQPIALALLRHAFARGHRLIGMALLAEGTAIGYRQMEKVAAEYGRRYGEDFVYLGFKPQYLAAILSMGESIRATFPTDYLDHPLDSLPLMRNVDSYANVAAVISVADGSLTTHWMEYAGARYHLTVLAGVTAAMITTYDPYLASGQMHAMVGGLRGAAQYESLIGHAGGGARGMMAQTSAHLYVILLIVVGNVVYFTVRRRGER